MTQLTKLDNIKRELFSPKTSKGFEALLPKNFDVKQFSASLWLEVQNNPKLQACDNIIDLARDCANFGLLPNGLAGQCYFLPVASPFSRQAKYRQPLIHFSCS